MGKIAGWKKVQNQKLNWKAADGTQIWVYPHQTWEISKKTGNIKKGSHKITHYTVRTYNPEGKSLAKALKGRHFKTQKTATKFARAYMRSKR